MIRVFNIERFAIKDGPGIRTVVFLNGCPLHCPWCSNPESRSIEGGKLRGADDILDEVMRDSDYYRETGGGLTLSGGEALCQGDEVTSLLRKARERGLHTAVETTGNVPERLFDAALPYVDLWLFDWKHSDQGILGQVTGADGEMVLCNLSKCDPSKVVLRMPCIPGFNMDEAHFEAAFDMASRMGIRRVDLLPYHTLGKVKYERMGMEYPYVGYEALKREYLEPYKTLGQEKQLTINIL